jgi:hypothetical protein
MRSVSLACLFISAGASLVAQQPRADLILVNGRVLTVDSADRVVQAVGISGNRIVAVGTNADVERAASPNARRIDLAGRAVTPGLLDAHDHFSGGGAERLYVLDLSYPSVKSIADVAAAIRTKAVALGKGAWIQGRGWDEGKLVERRVLTAADLDAASPDNPVVLTADHRPLRRREQCRASHGRSHKGHARPSRRHDRSQSRRHAHRTTSRECRRSRSASRSITIGRRD